MRRRLALLSLATTLLVVISFLVPLGLLVRQQAADRARAAAERQAQSTASLIALVGAFDVGAESVEAAVGPLGEGVIVVFSDGSRLGDPLPGQGSLVEDAQTEQATVTAVVDGGWEMALPVIGIERVAVVDVFVSDEQLTRGVVEAWSLLGLLGVVLIGAAVWVADRLGRQLVGRIGELAAAAHRMSEGDLEARVQPGEPEEIREVGEAFNTLADRLDELLIEEREAVADLSHRLRTPLTSLRLETEKIGDPDQRMAVIAQVDRLEQSIDQLILASRSRDDRRGQCELNAVVAERSAFWQVLADEQQREFDVALDEQKLEVGLSPDAVQAVIDALIGNVFAHTDPGTGFSISIGQSAGRPWMEVADEGSGFSENVVVGRGRSGRGSTGLGLDIVRRTAEALGGGLDIDDRPGGGAVVRVWFG